jgi:hypothetical protein
MGDGRLPWVVAGAFGIPWYHICDFCCEKIQEAQFSKGKPQAAGEAQATTSKSVCKTLLVGWGGDRE